MQETILNIAQFSLAALLTIIVLLQQKGASVGGIFGGTSNIYSTKRGVDKILHYSTIVLSIIFFSLSLARLII